MTHTRSLAGVLVALALATAACSGTGSSTSDEVAPPEAAPSYAGLPADVDYVALGDSFTAGPLIGTMRTDPQGCLRSRNNYPAFLAGWLDVASYTDVSCSAAVTSDLYGSQSLIDGGTAGPQLDALSEDTDLVTLGIGGNDFGIYSGLLACQGEVTQGAGTCAVDALRADAGKVRGNIAKAVRRIRDAAPESTVYVVGYPDILPTDGTCGAVSSVSPSILEPLTEVATALNASLRGGAKDEGATYVDLAAVSAGHDVCAKGAAWVNGPRLRTGIAAPFHPKINGMRAVATEVFREITGEDPEVSEFADPSYSALVLNED